MSDQVGTLYRGGGDASTISRRLAELKERGCVTAATGQAPPEAMEAVCRRMFGDPDLDRRRLLVTFSRESDPVDCLPSSLTPDDGNVLVRDRADAVREVAARVRDGQESPTDDVVRSHLDAVAGDVLDVAADVVSTTPGGLRVVVLRPDYLFPEIEAQSLASLVDFVARLRTLMERLGGMALLVVPRGGDDRVIRELREYVDVEFQVRAGPKFFEQRVVVDPGSTTALRSDWLELP